ncbi:hypothetical protein DDZ18_00085 [Marinicauda salina]|uniref:DUF2268 domain-containing protein n=1 Tax=Marinicauda salina TaxID=2135793 RepID=A0A2U2BVK9_9PROT|nr:hypothetical protein [Marinicauda salina]PWE18053.1 hypothetical protein DDZ18_00085 [Marinicauda salina]
MKKTGSAMLLLLALGAAASAAEPLPLEPRVETSGALTLEILDLTPRFLDFEAAARDADPDARFEIWEARYGFAAVPPTEEGREMARAMLDEAWPRYADARDVIEAGAAGLEPAPMASLQAVAGVLDADAPLRVRLVAYVGMFEHNAFTARGRDGTPAVSLPVEMDPRTREVTQAHEFAHAVHMELAGLSGGWERSIANTLLSEGLAAHVSREVVPGRPETAYIEHEPGWLERCRANAPEVLAGILPVLAQSDSETVMRFTIGEGPTGLEREAYCAGYLVIAHLRETGASLADIARVQDADMPDFARGAIEAMLAD